MDIDLKLGAFQFDHASYDEEGDVLYLRRGEPQEAADAIETEDGHLIRYDAAGNIIGVTLLSPRWLIENGREISIAVPVDSSQVAELLKSET